MRATLTHLRRDDAGLTTVEYMIVLCLIAAIGVATWQAFGDDVERYTGKSHTALQENLTSKEKSQ